MSDFIKLTMIDFDTHADPIEREILIRSFDIIAVHGDACVADSKCTEVITKMMDYRNTYYVKESVNEILRKIDPPDYTDLDKFIFDTPDVMQVCKNCKYEKYGNNTEPCSSCDYYHDNWEPKEDQND